MTDDNPTSHDQNLRPGSESSGMEAPSVAGGSGGGSGPTRPPTDSADRGLSVS
jgi:hypothetical protein